jgi:multiple sugar transport system permease protein
MFLMLLAGLQSIPAELYEAAVIDGAGPAVSFFRITLPSLKNVIRTTVLLAVINNFKQFPLFWTLTGGGPADKTTTLAVLTYKEAFVNLDFGTAAAVSTVWLALLVCVTLVYTRVFGASERE